MASKRDLSLTLLVVSTLLAGCLVPASIVYDDKPSPMTATMTGEDSFGNVIFSVTGKDMFDNGYQYGDYIEVSLNGFVTKPIFLPNTSCCLPYELGFYSNGEEYLHAFIFNSDLSEYSPIKVGDTILMKFHSHTTRMTDYPHLIAGRTTERLQGQSDEDFSNFRCLDLNGFRICRGLQVAYDHGDDRIKAGDLMYKKYNIDCDLNIAQTSDDCSKSVEKYRGKGLIDNYIGLYDSGCVECHYCHADTIYYAEDLRPIFQSILEHKDDNICLHCKVGKDRTGFAFIILESLAGWSVEDMSRDYCASFVNLYGVVEGSDEYKHLQKDYFGHILYMLDNPWLAPYSYAIDWENITYHEIDVFQAAKDFLIDYVGLTQSEFDQLKALVS